MQAAAADRPDARPDPTLPKGEQTRRSLLEAAMRVIARGGVEALTHRSVAEEAGVSRGTMTYHFASRDEIVLEAFRHYIDSVAQTVAATFDEVAPRDEGSIVEFLVRLQQREFAEPELVLAEYELILYAARNESLAREYRTWERSLAANLATGLEACGAPRPMHAARLLMGVFRSFELERLTHPDAHSEELRERLETLLPALLSRGD